MKYALTTVVKKSKRHIFYDINGHTKDAASVWQRPVSLKLCRWDPTFRIFLLESFVQHKICMGINIYMAGLEDNIYMLPSLQVKPKNITTVTVTATTVTATKGTFLYC